MLQPRQKVLAKAPVHRRPKADMTVAIGARFGIVSDYFVIMRLAEGGASPGAAGEMAKVSQAFQPSGLFLPANSP
jgi:hypothetical protein